MKKKKNIKVALILGTRPEVIKMAPIIEKLKRHPRIHPFVIITAQHRQMLDQMLEVFSIPVYCDLNIMKRHQNLSDITIRATQKLYQLIEKVDPDIVMVQGDTTTSFIGSLVAFYGRIPVAHIEAGLRTHDKYNPYPEEINRKLISAISDLHFAPTTGSKNNLLKEGIPGNSIYVTGNTVIDALLMIVGRIRNKNRTSIRLRGVDLKRHKLILVTAHRRENWGEPLREICAALKKLVQLRSDIAIVYPVHLNPNVQIPVYKLLRNTERIILLPPVDYEEFVAYLNACYLVLTDSGGIQEEAPSLGKPVLVLRKVTERPEAVQAGAAKVIGIEKKHIVSEVLKLLNNKREYQRMAQAINPYGDGKAAKRVVEALLYYFGLRHRPPSEFTLR